MGRFMISVYGATNLDGDSARFERYRDLGDGLFLETVRVNREAQGWLSR